MKHTFNIGFILLFASAGVFAQICDEDICGYWYTENNEAIIHIVKTENNIFSGKFCWLAEPNEPDTAKENYGQPKIDFHTGLLLLNSEILRNTTFTGDKWKGEIYDPRHGTAYKCIITLSDDTNIMILKGYIGVSLIGKRVVWKRKG